MKWVYILSPMLYMIDRNPVLKPNFMVSSLSQDPNLSKRIGGSSFAEMLT